MSAAIQMRREPLTSDEQQHVWQALCDDEHSPGFCRKVCFWLISGTVIS